MSLWYETITHTTATDTNTVVTFTDTINGVASTPFRATEVVVNNYDATNEVFVSFRGTVAATTSRRLAAGATLTFAVPSETDDGIYGIGLICSTGETATVQSWAVRPAVNPNSSIGG